MVSKSVKNVVDVKEYSAQEKRPATNSLRGVSLVRQ